MSYNVVTAWWIVKIFLIYTFMVVVLPYFVMRRFLKERSWTQKFVFSVVGGNFFYIMLVLLWGLLHITNRYVLIASTVVIPVIVLIRIRKELWEKHFSQTWVHVRRFFRREISFRYGCRIFFRWICRKIRNGLKRAGRFLAANFFELIFFVGCSAFILWFFSITNHFGPRASDLVVHMMWINEVDKGTIFSGGIYPFGMHALVYYMHAVFDIPTVRIVLAFGTVQTFYIFAMLLAFMKTLCRFRYTPYLCYLAYAVGDYIMGNRFSRFYSSLPQEFGMMFIFPCAIALVYFFRAVQNENAEYNRMKKEKLLYTQIDVKHHWKESTIYLWLLIICFGLTLSAHFYNTIIAGLLVIAAAIVYIRYVLYPKTLKRLIIAALVSVLIPVFPMAVAFAGGTPLEGSLYWALGVMGIDISDGEDTESDETTAENETVENAENDSAVYLNDEIGNASEYDENILVEKPPFTERVKQLVVSVKDAVNIYLQSLVFNSAEYIRVWGICMLIILVLVPVMWLLREWEYSRFLLLIFVYTGLLLLVAISGRIGLPSFLDENRSSIYLSYGITICLSLAVDGILLVLNHLIRVKWFWQLVSLVLSGTFAANMIYAGEIRVKTVNESSLERDGAALCVYNIMEKYPDKKWTIVSCNEERNMVSPVAWHYEVIDFLESMENYRYRDEMYIPTQYVFFFIEKESLNYAIGGFPDADATVSEEWASKTLPPKGGLSQYQGTNRIILNSRMYYWAQEYQKRFPNEMKVYYEDDDFICYYIEQNEYYLNNFAIDYGYNSGGEAG